MREKGNADRYRNLRVNYIDHHNPDLVLFDEAGEETHRIDLTRLRTKDNIHKVARLLGLKEICKDELDNCPAWKNAGECSRNPTFMEGSCRLSCGLCTEADGDAAEDCVNAAADSECEYWSTMGECESNPSFMHASCARACGICKVSSIASDELDDDDDDDDDDGGGEAGAASGGRKDEL